MDRPSSSRRIGRRVGRAAALCGALGMCAALAQTPAGAQQPSAARQTELARLLRNDCGACHGMTLKGGLGLPLTADALAGKPAEALVQTVLRGRPGTAMPPWSPFISEMEATWLIERLQAGQAPDIPPSGKP